MSLYKISSYDYREKPSTFRVTKMDGSVEELDVGSNFSFLNNLLFLTCVNDLTLYIRYKNQILEYFFDIDDVQLRSKICECEICALPGEGKAELEREIKQLKEKETMSGGISPEYLSNKGKTVIEKVIENMPEQDFIIKVKISIPSTEEREEFNKTLKSLIEENSKGRKFSETDKEIDNIFIRSGKGIWQNVFGGETNNGQKSTETVNIESEYKYYSFYKTFEELLRSPIKTPDIQIFAKNDELINLFCINAYNSMRQTSNYKYWLDYEYELTPIDYLAAFLAPPSNPVPGINRRKEVYYGTQVEDFKSEESVKLGNLLTNVQTNIPIAIRTDDLTSHAFITGVTGSGKTTTIKNILKEVDKKGIAYLVLEPAKNEYKNVCDNYYQIGRPESGFKLNPLYFPDGVHIQTHIDYIKSVFVAAFPMYGPMPYILETAIYNVYRNKGWNIVTSESIRKTKEYPTIEDLFYEIDDATEMAGYSKDLQSDVKGALKVRISSLMVGAKGATLNCTESTDFGTIINKPTVVNLESIGDAQEKIFIMGLILTSMYEYYIALNEETTNLKNMLVIEEAHRLLENVSSNNNPEIADMKGKSLETFNNILSEIRAYGQGIIIADQIPSKLSPDVIKNTNLKIVHRLFAKDDRELIGSSIGLDEDQTDYLIHLHKGEAIAFYDGLEDPVKIKVDSVPKGKIELDKADDNQKEDISKIGATDNPIFVSECCKMLRTALFLNMEEAEFDEKVAHISEAFKNESFDKEILWKKMLRVIVNEIKDDILNTENYTEYQNQLNEIASSPYNKLLEYIKSYTEQKDIRYPCENVDLFEMFYPRDNYEKKLKSSKIMNENLDITVQKEDIVKIAKCGKKFYVSDDFDLSKFSDCIIYNTFLDNPNVWEKYFGLKDI